MANKNGTTFLTENGDASVFTALTDESGNATMARCASTATIPSAKAGYAVGCLLTNATTGSLFINQGSTTSCSFQDVNRY